MAWLILIYGTIAVIALVWLVVLILNLIKVLQITKLEPDEAPKTGAWVAWGISIFSMFTSCVPAVIGWIVIEWILPPIDPFEDTLGTVQLYGRARSNISFIIIANIIVVLLVLMPMLMT